MTHPTDPVAAMREACAKACVIAARECPGSSDEETTWREAAMWCLNRIRALPLPATPADDAVARALRDIKAMSLGHHAHEDPAVLLHALLVEIPTAIDYALLAAERAQRDAGAVGDQRAASDEKGGDGA